MQQPRPPQPPLELFPSSLSLYQNSLGRSNALLLEGVIGAQKKETKRTAAAKMTLTAEMIMAPTANTLVVSNFSTDEEWEELIIRL